MFALGGSTKLPHFKAISLFSIGKNVAILENRNLLNSEIFGRKSIEISTNTLL